MPRFKHVERSPFKTTLHVAITNVQGSLNKFARLSGKKLAGVVVSSNVSLGVNNPADKGVAVWFTWDDLGVCIAVDRYASVEGNLQAIHHVLEARCTELRHGTLALTRATMKGFLALPAPDPWWKVLGLAEPVKNEVEVEKAFREKARSAHPDRGGSHDAMARLNLAREQGLKEVCA
jgi:hypothetical protein